MKENKYKGTTILAVNGKMKKSAKEMGVKLFNFGIPALKDKNGKMTCPFALKCASICFAQKGAYKWGNVEHAYEQRLALTKESNFIDVMATIVPKKKADYVRIHDSGDFYSPKYLKSWLEIIHRCSDHQFYAYTKSVEMVKNAEKPSNFRAIYSYGGKQDHLIDPEVDPHAIIVYSDEEMQDAISRGYVDCSHNDLLIYTSNKIALMFH